MKKLISICIAAILLFGCFGTALADGTTGGEYGWRQGDKRWNEVTSGIKWSKACAVTSLAIQIARSGLVYVDEGARSFNTSNKEGFNPGTFAKSWLSKKGLTSNASVTWGTVSDVVAGFYHKTDSRYTKASKYFSYYPAIKKGNRSAEQRIVDSLTAFYEDGYYILVEGPGSKFSTKSTGSRHYVAVVGADGSKVWVIDPIDGKRKSLFDVQPAGSGTRWTAANLDICGDPKGYACCVLYQVDPQKVLTPKQEQASSITLKNEKSPSGEYQIGEKFYFKGVISSVYPLKSIYGGIFDASGREVQTKYYAPNAKTFDIAKTLDYMIRMGKLPAGSYVYVVHAEDTKGYATIVIQRAFTIVDAKAAKPAATAVPKATEPPSATPVPAAATPEQAATPAPTQAPYEELKVTISGEASPSGSYAVGSKFYFKGTLTSNTTIDFVYGGIFTSDGKEAQCFMFSCKGTSFDIYKTFDRSIRMGKLPAGDYIYMIRAVDENGLVVDVIRTSFRME